MRILLMIASLAESGGTEMLVRNLALEYARRGHRCHIAYISDAASLGASAAFERGFVEALDAAGITHAAIGHRSRRNLALGAWRLRRMVREMQPDVIHNHLGFGLLFQAVGLIARPTVYTHHNIVFRFPPLLFRLFDRFVRRYVAICEACRGVLAARVRRPVALVYNGVPAGFAVAAPRTALPRDIEVLSVGNLTPQKDHAGLIAAAGLVIAWFAADGRRIRFSIAGEGGERGRIEAAIAAAGIGDSVRLLGVRRDVAALMARADLLVMASRFEGFPIALVEAAMSALPAIATDVGGCGEIVLDGETGMLVPPGRPDLLAAAIVDTLSDEARYVGFSRAAERHGRRFTLESCADGYLAVYEQAIRDGRRREAVLS